MLTKIVYDKYWRSWFLHDYKASSGEEAKKGFYKKNYKNVTNEISNNKKKRFFYIFRLGKPRVTNLIVGIHFLKFYINHIFLTIFFYRSKPLVAKVAKKQNQKNFFLAKILATYLFSDNKCPAKIWRKAVTFTSPKWKSYMELPPKNHIFNQF